MRTRWIRLAAALALAGAAQGCEYVRLLRPSVLKQLNPRMVALVNELPDVDRPNKEMLGQLFAQGGLRHARLDRDGVMRARVHLPEGEFVFKPAIVVMPRTGELELEIHNNDRYFHLPYLPSEGGRQILELPSHTAGSIRVRFVQPGLYTFADGIANFSGRGMLGAVIVRGDVPADARLERPRQERP
jgi:PQQ system protein